MIGEKEGLVSSNLDRSGVMKDIAEAAAQDKDSAEKKWAKVYLCHRLV